MAERPKPLKYSTLNPEEEANALEISSTIKSWIKRHNRKTSLLRWSPDGRSIWIRTKSELRGLGVEEADYMVSFFQVTDFPGLTSVAQESFIIFPNLVEHFILNEYSSGRLSYASREEDDREMRGEAGADRLSRVLFNLMKSIPRK